MSQSASDFAVIGNTPLARLLAGLLATAHDRKVVFVGESHSGYRLPRSVDLSVAPITRPETWALLAEGVAETGRLISRIGGRTAMSRVDPIFFANEQRSIEAMSHVRYMAQGFRIAAEPVPSSLVGSDRQGIVLRDALRLNRPILEPALDQWLSKSGVQHLRPDKIEVALDGSVIIANDGQVVAAEQAVLADDDAIISWLPLRQWPTLFRRQASAAILSSPTLPMPAPIMLDLGSDTVLLQQAEGGVAGIGRGDLAQFSTTMQALMGPERRAEQAGQTGFTALSTTDGAPALGRAAGVGADVVAGFGTIGAFLAPALARWLAGEAQQHQAKWFGARLVDRNLRAASVADFASPASDSFR